MMKEEALHKFWSSFGLPAYLEMNVQDLAVHPEYPYITYEVGIDTYNNSVPLTASIWDKKREGYQIDKANALKAQEISSFIGMSGVKIKCDDGYLWIQRRSPFAQPMEDTASDRVVRELLNITVNYITEN